MDVPGPPLFTACIRDISERQETEKRLRDAELRFRTLVEQLPLISYVDASNSNVSKPLYLSPQIESFLGYTPDEWLSTPGLYQRSLHPDDRERVLAQKAAAYQSRVPLRNDDFGTGYSSLSLLQDLPVHLLKIDRTFVRSVESSEERRAFVRAIVELAEALSLAVIAEGIEAPAQAAELRRLGCRLGQGFLFSRPLEPRDLETQVTSGALPLRSGRHPHGTRRSEAA